MAIATTAKRAQRAAPRHSVHDLRAARRRALAVERGESRRHRAGLAVADRAAVHFRDAGELAHGAGAESLVGAVQLGEREVANLVGDLLRRAGCRAPSARVMPSGQAATVGVRTTPSCDHEEVRRVRLRDEPALIEHERIVRPRGVGLDLREDRVQQVRVMDLRVEARPATAGASCW